MKSFSFFSFDHMLILLLMLSLWFSFSQPLCHDDERSSLLQFKQSLAVENFASRNPLAYPKAASWTGEGSTSDCCQWDGVECDSDTGHVIGLDLSSSFLYGSIPDTRCERCAQSGGMCGFDTDTEGPLCLCSPSSSYTTECGTNK